MLGILAKNVREVTWVAMISIFERGRREMARDMAAWLISQVHGSVPWPIWTRTRQIWLFEGFVVAEA